MLAQLAVGLNGGPDWLVMTLQCRSLDGAGYLLEKGANRRIKNVREQSALDMAKLFKMSEFVELFEAAYSE